MYKEVKEIEDLWAKSLEFYGPDIAADIKDLLYKTYGIGHYDGLNDGKPT